MADISKIKIKGIAYNLKDTAARASINNLPKYMNFKGTLGTGGTITSLPAASSAVVGHVYSVITAGTYAGISTKVGDMLVCSDTPAWVILPAGEKGDKGDTGAKGETGERGPQGPKGADGVTPTIKAADGTDINVVGTPSVTANTVGTTTTFTFNNLKGAKGDAGPQGPQGVKGDTGAQGPIGVTPTIKAAAGTNIDAVGTPSVTANTSGTTTTFTFNNLKGATGAQGPQGPTGPKGTDGVTPTIKAASGAHINATGTPSVTAATSGNTTTFTFDYLKGAQGPQGEKGDTGLQGPTGEKGDKGDTGPAGPGIATGGTAGQYLVKNSTTNYDTKWATLDLSGYETKANASATYATITSVNTKQDKLVSGTNIKTINNESLLGSGNVELATKAYVDSQIRSAINDSY